MLEDTIGVREEETESYNMAIYLNNCLTPIFLAALTLEMASFFLYTNLVMKTLIPLYLSISRILNLFALDASLEANNQRRNS